MAEETKEDKRPAVKARKTEAQQAKGARRKQRSGNGPRSADRAAYGTRNVRTLHQGPGISITVQLPLGRKKSSTASKGKTSPDPGRAQAPSAHRRIFPQAFRPLLAVLVIAALGAGFYLYPSRSGSDKPAETAAAAERTTPDYSPVVPSAEKTSASSYDAKRNMVSYNVTFSGARLTVSQQALPADFTKDPSAIMKAADSIKATQQIETDKGLLYIATNEEAGNQLAVIAGKAVLIFIHADKKVDDATWQSFVNLLEAKSWEAIKS